MTGDIAQSYHSSSGDVVVELSAHRFDRGWWQNIAYDEEVIATEALALLGGELHRRSTQGFILLTSLSSASSPAS
jgi:hypothetical protein